MKKTASAKSMSAANRAKAKHGQETKARIAAIFAEAEREGRIASCTCDYAIGKQGYSNGQFYAPFVIQFGDGERWLIYSTSTLRDRIKMYQWDAYNIKDIDSHVTKAYLIYPSDIPDQDRRAFVSKNAKYQRGEEYSALDGLIDWDELRHLIREKADAYYALLYGGKVSTNEEPIADGRYYDYVGRAFEREIAETLANPAYLDAFKYERHLADRRFLHFKQMLSSFQVDAKNVVSIAATADRRIIGDLPSGGAPKTDIIMTAKMNDGTEVVKTISCKRVTGDTVSAHQYKADEYARVLDPANEQLRLYLNYFQTAGNFRDMPEHAEQTLAKLLAPYLEKLCYWVVGGNGGGGDAGQIASHVVAYRPEDNAFSVHSVDEYVHWLLTKCRPKRGGTPFGWTYQGERGSNIQLKMPVFFA